MGCGSSTPAAVVVQPSASPNKLASTVVSQNTLAVNHTTEVYTTGDPIPGPAPAAAPAESAAAMISSEASLAPIERPFNTHPSVVTWVSVASPKAAAGADAESATGGAPAEEKPIEAAVAAPGEEKSPNTFLDPDNGYLDDAAFENGHAILAEKIARDQATWAQMNSKAVPPAEGTSFPLAMIADQDEASQVDQEDGKRVWVSKLGTANLVYVGNKDTESYRLELGPESTLWVDRGDKSGRGAEYSALEVFDGRLLTMDDRTGDIDEIVPNVDAGDNADAAYKVKPLVDADGKNVVLKLGDGSKDKPLKIEWASQKSGKLVVGSTGKERTDDDSCVVHHGEMWVKILEPGTFSVTNIDGTQAFNGLRASANVGPAPAVGEKSAGYMIHESGRWSDVHGRWFFLPRKLSRGTYDEIADASKCVNLMLSGPDFAPGAGINNDYADCLVQPYLGFLELRGCSDFLFVPGTNDCHLFVMRTEESLDGVISTYSSVIDLQGRVLMRESKIAEDRKFEGAAWVGGWASFVGPGAPPSAPGGGCPVQ